MRRGSQDTTLHHRTRLTGPPANLVEWQLTTTLRSYASARHALRGCRSIRRQGRRVLAFSGRFDRALVLAPGVIEAPALVPEIDVADLAASLLIYRNVFGFQVLAQRPEEAFAYVAIGSAHLMLQQAAGPGRRFRTAPLERPYGRGINLQIHVPDVTASYERVQRTTLEIVVQLEDRWYRQSDSERGNRQFVVADPDGYLLRFYRDLGSRSQSHGA